MKKISVHYLFALSLLIFTFSCSEDSETSTEPQNTDTTIEATQILNVAYGNDSEQVYDIYLPENRDENTKILILVHGGGWTSGDKTDMNPYKIIAQEDIPEYAIVNINYRLASQGVSPFPMQLNDITSVINHLKTNQSEYIISQDYGFVGVSAGAHLAMLWSYSYDTEHDVNMVASIVGPTNLADAAYNDNPAFQIDLIMQYFGETPSLAFLETYSPLHQVITTSPPTILFYGGLDPLIPNSQGITMDAKLTELDITHDFTFYPNEGHGWVGANLFDTWTKLKLFIITNH
ncbi:alpha/beta hydrolase [Lacinutrix mariniflava]|uniref:alpha/beta hydrolase n=1 Tax=Lacinutrix mariniflava TaxID=342955 RepID=UPI0006E43403|nr:alpha/beta hydrolase [Lacinutrix mariniflava]